MALLNNNQDDYDNDDAPQVDMGFPIFLIVLILSPFTIASALITYAAFARGRIRLSVIFWYGLVPYIIAMIFFWQYAIANFIVSWTHTIPAMIDGSLPIVEGLFSFFMEQALVGIPIGIIVGMIYASIKWKARLSLIEKKFRLTPKEYYIKWKTRKNIQANKNIPEDGMTLGVDDDGLRIVQKFANSKAHTIVIGASGSGKTEVLLSRVRDSINNQHGACIVDLKGGHDLPERIAQYCEREGIKFIHFVPQPLSSPYTGPAVDGPAHYDPLNRGEATRRKDLFLNTREYSNDYYKQNAEAFLQLVFSVIVANPNPNLSTLEDMLELSTLTNLQKRAAPLASQPQYASLVKNIDALLDEKLDDGQKSAVKGLENQVSLLINSIVGPYLQRDTVNNNNINLFESAIKGEVVLFSLDTSNYPELSAMIANLVIQDCKTISSELREYKKQETDKQRLAIEGVTGKEKKRLLEDLKTFEPYKPFHIVIDEFSAIGSENIIGLINKCRDANMPITLTTQALGDLRKNNKSLQDQLLGIVNSFIIMRSNVYDDAIELANLAGKTTRKRFSESVSYVKKGWLSQGSSSGKGNVEEVEDYVIPPTKIQELGTGEFYHINKSPMKIEHGYCIMEDSSKVKFKEIEIREVTVDETELEQISLLVAQKEFAPDLQNIGSVNTYQTEHYPLTPQMPTEPLITPSRGIESRPENRDRLREIMNQDPDEFSPLRKEKSDFTVVHMPPRESEPLKTTPPLMNKKLPPLPSLPALPQINKPNTPPLNKPVGNKPANLPSLPVLPKINPAIPAPKDEPKDEFDF